MYSSNKSNFEEHDDQEQSSVFTIENSVNTGEETDITDAEYTNTNDSHDNIFDNRIPNNCLLNVGQENVSTSNATHGNNLTLHELEQKLREGFERLRIQNVSKLPERIQRAKQRINEYQEEDRAAEVERETVILTELLELEALAQQVSMSITSSVNEKDEECPITEESLRNMHDDFSSMPCCSERSIIYLMYYISLKLIGNTIDLDHIDTEIEKEFQLLEKRLKIEELETKEIQRLVGVGLINVKRESWKSALVVLKQVLKMINSLNIQEMFRLVKKVDDAAKLINGKEIILFLGGTGTGKSTLIHFFAGSEMTEKTVQGLNHIAPIKIKNLDAKNVTTSPFARSETRSITPVTVDFADVGGHKSGNIILCDSPGFDDTSGVEVDIANGIGILKAIKACRRVKPVVLTSFKSIGDRLEGLKKVTHTLAGLIPGIRDHMNAFSYIFTKFPQNERNTIYSLLENVRKTLSDEEKSDSSFVNFLQDMLKKTKKGALTIDPINDEPGDILDELADSNFIADPEDVFQFSISEKSKSILQEQVRKHQFSIMSATNRSEYAFVKYKLDQLKYLNELLNQDYIEQIYNDCIRYISRHLSEEYEEGISTLNRCLMNQIVLNNEDVIQYQTRIDHAKLAEESISKHLDKEVIHSSEFIQYMNKQVDIMLGDLKEKDINDPSVKICLDKIKLLSKYFLDVDYKYKDTCQSLSKKLDNIVDIFKSSVLSNNFDNSANEITKLYEASTLLQDHLDHQNMETKYFKLKEYFLNYLNDSVEKLNNIVSQEKLNENGVERINNCLSMLESVNNTYTLRPHISKEAINEIYEEFLLKILKHFEEIIEKIQALMQTENSYHKLEQLVKEMDLMRTISIVKSKTNPSYYSILERSVGYIQEARRDIENILKTFVQGEGNVNYTRLPKCLSNLKNAKWIEAYRPGVYSDVETDVEEQIIQHVEELHKSIMDVNLDLDNFDKIKNIYIKIGEINEIKRVEGSIQSVSKYINEVNSWFETVTNEVFILIKDTFISKQWKDQQYQDFDFNRAEKAFCYLSTCKTIRILFKSDCTSILSGLEIVIKDFSNFIHKDIENCFESIKQHENENNKARIFLNHLREISEIKTKYPHVFSCFSNLKIIEHWQNELANYLNELSEDMEKLKRTQQIEALSIKLLVVKALSKLDTFLTDEKYNDIHRKYQDVFFSQANDVCKQVMDAIKNSDYERVGLEMATLQSSNEVGGNFVKQAKRELKDSVDQLMNKTKDEAMRGENIEIEGIKSVVENLKQMESAKKYIQEYLSTSDEIGECIIEVKRIIADRTKRFIDNIKALITIYNFSEANQKIDSLLLMHMLLKKCSTDDVSSQIEALQQFETDVVSNIVTKYSNMDIGGFMLNPPKDIFEKFEIVKDTKPIFKKALDIISETIVKKFKDEFMKTRIKMISDPEHMRVKKIESTFVYLPERMKDNLEMELKSCKDEITLVIQDNNQKLDDVFHTGNLKNIKSILVEYQTSEGMQSFVNKGRDLTSKRVQEIVIKINEDFGKNNIREALSNAKKLYDYKNELEDIVSGIKEPYYQVEIRVKTICQNAFLAFINQFKNINISVATNETTESMEKYFICLMEFMKFKDEYQDQAILTYILPQDFNENLIKLNKNISNYFRDHQKNYEIAFEIMDMISLKNTLSILSNWNFLFTRIKQYESINSNENTSVNTIIRVIKEVTLYSEMLESITGKIQNIRNKLINQELINDNTKEFNKNRDQFYYELNENLSVISQTKILSNFNISIDFNTIENECIEILERKITEIVSLTKKFSEKILTNDTLSRQDYDNFNVYYSNLISFKQQIKMTCFMIDEKIEQIDRIVSQQIQSWELLAEQNPTVHNISLSLINMKRLSNNILSFKMRINEKIDQMLKRYKTATKGTTTFVKLATVLNQDVTGIGQSIISEHKIFQGYSLSLFNEKTRRHGINYVLENLKGDALDNQRLKKRYEEFYTIYEKLIKQYLKPNIELARLISDIKLMAGNLIQKSNSVEWNANIREKVPSLTAHIFALWTLKNADLYFEAVDSEDKNNYLLQPHAAQVISIFRILGIGDRKEELNNNLVEIGTGEGKSVTLAVTASILALLGFDVCCACYSQYLSQRDYTAFLPLFDSLGLLNYIHYGTFNKLCEDTINENGDIRQIVEQLIAKGFPDTMKNSQRVKRCKILLIDEVDVFFNREFYGNVYTPAASLRDPTITSLVNFIWKERESNLSLNKIKDTDEYKICCATFPTWEALIQEAIKDMLSDVNNFKSHDYVVNQGKIGYPEQDNIVYNIVYGYKTLFAYYHEHDRSKISKESLEKNISIRIKCGSFSYAEIPLEFKYIMGVTGTLKTLSDPEKSVIQNIYKIKKNTFIPSVFGQNNLKFIEKDDIMIENSDDYFNTIKREISNRVVRGSSEKRAVLVIFETNHKLKEFYNSEALAPIRESVVYLTEGASLDEKEDLIKRATSSGQITLLPKIFGRGCDFVCHDQNVARNGGVHVIQTFLSEEVSEEVQIKGRTARQGDQGSYSMVLLYNDLEKFLIEKDHIEAFKKDTKNSKTVYDFLNNKRTDSFKTQYEANTKYVEQAKDRHKIARKFLSSLHSGDIESIKQFLIEENKGVAGILNSRTICLMDATGSMSQLLHKCKNTVDIMVERAAEILQDNNIRSDSFQIQFVVYRNYNSQENKILQYSPWETKPDNLRAFMDKIVVEGGMGNEAIEIGLWHANKENERENITQVILIGDAPPNTRDEVIKRRKRLGEEYWKETKFSQPTYYEDELAKLTSNGIPVHAFFVVPAAEEKFTEIATRTGGRCKMLNINSSEGSKMLTDFITVEILRNVGRESANGDALAAAYENRFGRTYT